MVLLENIAKRYIEVNQAAVALGRKPRPIAPDVAVKTRMELENLRAEDLLWKDYLAKVTG